MPVQGNIISIEKNIIIDFIRKFNVGKIKQRLTDKKTGGEIIEIILHEDF